VLGIGFRKIGERKKIGRKEEAGERLSVARRLRETMIETASACAGNVSDDAVHHLTALLVGVEILIEKMTEKAPALGNADSVDALNGRCGLRIVFQIGKKIADSSEAEADHEGFWARQARERLLWHKRFAKVLDESNAPFFKWFPDGELNASYNCLDRHLTTQPDKIAIIFEADDGKVSLSGYVWSNDSTVQAKRVASRVPGVTSVSDQLELERAGGNAGAAAVTDETA